MIVTVECECGAPVSAEVQVWPRELYSIGEFGPMGATFADPAEADVIGCAHCIECGADCRDSLTDRALEVADAY